MSTPLRWRQRFANFKKALGQLEKAVLQSSYNELEIQGLIQCFEYTIELAWKTLQDVLHSRGYAVINGPRPVLKMAFQIGLISEDEEWLLMWDDRLTTSHTYDEAAANAIAARVKNHYINLFRTLAIQLDAEPPTH